MAGTLRDLIFTSGITFAKIPATLLPPPIISDAWIRRAQVSIVPMIGADGGDERINRSAFLYQKVLRFWMAGIRFSPRLTRINSDLPLGSSLAVRGDALIHGPSLVARPVGSEWRTRRPYQMDIQTN